MSDENGRRELLERRATEVRHLLERRLNVMDERTRRMAELAKNAARPAVMVVGAVVLVTATVLLLKRRHDAARPAQRLRSRLGVAPRRKNFLVRGLERAAVALIATTAQRLGTRGIDRLIAVTAGPEKPLPARALPGARDRTTW